jgi:hypothetical protein|tara:strand:+ start:1586 stop:2461 length:876 start_codon:yes stop_codon:yes gene_type:complete
MFSDIMVNYILKDENALVEAPEVNTSQLPPEFFAGHASERLSDPLRVHDENENSEVKTRTIQGLVDAGIMGPLGNYIKNAPKHVAVRTHFLDSYRNPIGVNEKGLRHSHGNTIVSIVRPHKKHRTPQVQTVMLRGNNQKFERGSGVGTMNVEHVIDASPEKMKTNNPQVAIRRARKAKKKKAARVRILPPLPPGPKTVNKMVLIKAPKRKMSEAARQHKLAYDKKYESSPERVKYRVELNRERRRRGIYGSNNKKDISHTQGGKFTLENQSSNRARHFKNRGTLRKVKVKK